MSNAEQAELVTSEAVSEPVAPAPDIAETRPAPDVAQAAPASETPERSTPESTAVVALALKNIDDKLSESNRLIERQAEVAANLHAENQTLRAGELRKAQGALILSVLRVLDDVSQMAVTAVEPAARTDLELVADSLADALARNGIDAATVSEGEAFDGRRHKIAAIEPSSESEADRTVARVVRPGFVWSDGEVIRVSDVAVFKYTPAPETATPPAAEQAPVAPDDTAQEPTGQPPAPVVTEQAAAPAAPDVAPSAATEQTVVGEAPASPAIESAGVPFGTQQAAQPGVAPADS